MKLYYIHADDCNGDSLDLFVREATKLGALEKWAAYYNGHTKGVEPKIWLVPEGKQGVLEWRQDVLEV